MNIRILISLVFLLSVQSWAWAQPINPIDFDIKLSNDKIGKLDPLMIDCTISNRGKTIENLSVTNVNIQIKSFLGKWEKLDQRRFIHGPTRQNFIPKLLEVNQSKSFDLALPYLRSDAHGHGGHHHHGHHHDHDHDHGVDLTLHKNGTYYVRVILELQDGRIFTSSEQRFKVVAYRGADKEVAKILSKLDHPFFLSDEHPSFYYQYRKQAQDILRKYPNSKFGTLAGIFEAYWSVLRPYDKPYFKGSSVDSVLTKHRRNTDGAIVKRAEMVLDLKKNINQYRAQ